MNWELIIWTIIFVGFVELFYWVIFKDEYDNFFVRKVFSIIFSTFIVSIFFLIYLFFKEIIKSINLTPTEWFYTKIFSGGLIGLIIINYVAQKVVDKYSRKIKSWFK